MVDPAMVSRRASLTAAADFCGTRRVGRCEVEVEVNAVRRRRRGAM